MKVEELMVKNVSCCRMSQNLAEIAEIFWKKRRGSLPVLDENGNVGGIITDRDLAIALGTRNLRASEVRVRDVAPPRVFTCRAGDDALEALETMTIQNVRRLPVVDEKDRLAGMLSIDDLIRRAALQLPGEAKFHVKVMGAIKSICDAREPGVGHEPAELLAMHG